MIIDGKALAAEVLARAKARAAKLARPPLVRAVTIAPTAATESYLRVKSSRAADAGVKFEALELGRNLDQDIVRAVAAASDSADALIVQLPVPPEFDQKAMCDAIPVEKDADVLSTAARSAFMRGDEQALLPPVVGALAEILAQVAIKVARKKAVVIGAGYLVGGPCAAWLAQNGAQVITVNQKSGDLASALVGADIVVSGAGVPHLIQPDMLKKGVVFFDAGTSESDGALAGDADPACAEKCSIFTPVPGGVGPIAVAKLFENAVILTEKATKP